MPAAAQPATAAPLVGSLVDFPVDQVLRLVTAGGRNGTFTVAGALPLALVIDGGAAGPAGGGTADRAELVELLFHLTLVGDGDFSFDPAAPAEEGERWPLDEVLRDVSDRVERWRRISAVLPSLDVVVRLTAVEPGRGPLELPATSWNCAVALDGQRRVRDVTLLLGGDAFATMEAIHGLVTQGLATVVPPADAAPR